MANKRKYNDLDDIGFVGVQDKRTKSQIKRDLEATAQFIKDQKSGKRTRKVSSRKNRV